VFHEPSTGAANDIDKATDRPRHGDRVRHERAAGRPQVRQRRRRAVPRPGHVAHQGLPKRSPPRSTRRCAVSSRPRTTRPGRSWPTARSSTTWFSSSWTSETLAGNNAPDLRADPDPPSRGSYTGYGKRLPSDRPPVLTPKELALTAATDGQDMPAAATASPAPRGSPAAPPRPLPPFGPMTPCPASRFDRADRPPADRAGGTGILVAIGEDPDRDGLADTPARVARAYAEQFSVPAPGGRWARCSMPTTS
jgi:cell division protease FtsH